MSVIKIEDMDDALEDIVIVEPDHQQPQQTTAKLTLLEPEHDPSPSSVVKNPLDYQLNAPTVIKIDDNSSPVFYLDRSKWYDFRVRIVDRSVFAKELLPIKQLLFNVYLTFVEEDYRQKSGKLFADWRRRHPDTRLLEVTGSNNSGAHNVIYNPEKVNCVNLIMDSSDEMHFSVRVNCVPSQFVDSLNQNPEDQETNNQKKPLSFFLAVNTHSKESGRLLDTTLCQIKTFWFGRAQPNYEIDRIRSFTTNPPFIACPLKYQLIQTILSPEIKDAAEDQMDTCVLPSSPSENLPFSKFPIPAPSRDRRHFVCILEAPLNLAQTVSYLDLGTPYGLALKPMIGNLDASARESTVMLTTVRIDFSGVDPERLTTALTNWTILTKKKSLFELDPQATELDDSVHDLYMDSCRTMLILWVPAKADELKIWIKFNAESSQLARYLDQVGDFKMELMIETTELEEGLLLDRSQTAIQIFSAGIAERQLQIDKTQSSLSTTRTFQEFTILKNTTPKQPPKSKKMKTTPTTAASSSKDPTTATATSSSASAASQSVQEDVASSSGSGSFQVVDFGPKLIIKIHELFLDGEKIITLQERLVLERRTVSELESRVLDLIKRKSRHQNATTAAVFLWDTPVTDEMLLIDALFETEDSPGYKCRLITNDLEAGSFLAYLGVED